MSQEMSREEMMALLKTMQEQNAAQAIALKEVKDTNQILANKLADAVKPNALSFKVSEKGCVSIYGMNRRGIHLYGSQFLRLFREQDKIKTFIEENRKLLSWKDEE